MSTHLFNRDANGDTSQIPLGGLPIYHSEIINIQDNIQNYGLTSILAGYTCILGGCYVDAVNTTAKTVKVTPGTVLIKDVVVEFPGYEGPYPFAIQLVETDIDSRAFKVGTTFDVGKEYSTSIRTNFNYGTPGSTLQSVMPTDLSGYEIFFDPFTAQRSDYIISNNARGYNDIIPKYRNSSVTRTETGRSIVGPALNFVVGNGEARWKYFGFSNYQSTTDFVMRNGGTEGGNPGTIGGSNNARLGTQHLPRHQHTEAEGYNGSLVTYDGDNNSYNGSHSHKLVNDQGAIDTGAEFGSEKVRGGDGAIVNGSEFRKITGTDYSGKHKHGIAGKTGSHDETWGSNESFSVRSRSLYCQMLRWRGAYIHSGFYKFYRVENNFNIYPNM